MPKSISPKQLFLLFFVLLISISYNTTAQTRYYVDSTSGNDASSGTSWSTAFRNITRAVAAANASTAAEVAIWVAHGTYTPIEGIATLPTDNRDTSFTFYRGNGIGKALKVYGGFAGTELSVASRDTSHPTYLEGNFATGLFSYHVVVIVGLAAAADSVVVDGFTIRHGHANSSLPKVYNGVSIDGTAGSGIHLSANGSPKLALRNCKFVTNYNARRGGGIYMAGSSPLIENCSVISNTALGFGAGMFNSSSTPRIINCRFELNHTRLLFSIGYGGAMYNQSSSPIISGCTFMANMVHGDGTNLGGAIYNATGSNALIDNCIFSANRAIIHDDGKGYGGAIYNQSCSPIITHCTFERNNAESRGGDFVPGVAGAYGGAIVNAGGAPTIDSCNFTSNSCVGWGDLGTGIMIAGTPDHGYSFGGAICNLGSAPAITNCLFVADTAWGRMPPAVGYVGKGYGGAIFDSASTPEISNCTFDANVARGEGYSDGQGYGGAICNTAVTVPVAVTSCSFSNNRCNSEGGAIYQTLKKLTLTDCLFTNNTAETGGAVALRYIYLMHFTGRNNIFVGNTATTSGGGAINIDNGGGTDTMINNLFAYNKDAGGLGGGAILITRGAHFIVNNTFFADSALAGGTGGAIHVVSVPVSCVFANNIFSGAFGAGASPDAALAVIGTYAFTHNLFSVTNPLFLNPSNLTGADGVWRTDDDGLQLTRCSPARNAGFNAYVMPGVTTDIAGSARIRSTSVDMGAYESNPIGAITGIHDLCVGASAALGDTTAGGVWISKNTAIATISSTGIVTGVSPGIDTILYVVGGTCGTDTAFATILIHPASLAGSIAGGSDVCVGGVMTLTATLTGGTWSASNTNATVVAGVVTGVTAGTVVITYTNSCGGAYTTTVVTVNGAPSAGVITGPSVVCAGASITLTDAVPGGVWSVVNPTAAVSAGGIVTGVIAGVDTVMYTVTSACGVSSATKVVTVNPLPVAGTVTGASTVCVGSSTMFFAIVPGGTWSASNSNATVGATGIVTGVVSGVDTIIYAVSNSCGTDTVHSVITVNPLPVSGTISGPSSVCVGAVITLSASVAGGAWTVTNANATVLSGSVTGVAAGLDTVAYTIVNTCGSSTATYVVTVSPMPDAGTIAGPDTVCVGSTILLTDTATGGTWSVSNTHGSVVAGLVTGLSEGLDTVYYSVTNTCGTAAAVKVIRINDCAAAVTPVNTSAMVPIRVYPDPASDFLIIESAAGMSFSLSDVYGKRFSTYSLSSDKEVVRIGHLLPGTYLLLFSDQNGRKQSMRVIKQ